KERTHPLPRERVALRTPNRVTGGRRGVPKSGGCLVGLGPDVGMPNTARGAVHVPHESGRLRASEMPGCAQFRHKHNMLVGLRRSLVRYVSLSRKVLAAILKAV